MSPRQPDERAGAGPAFSRRLLLAGAAGAAIAPAARAAEGGRAVGKDAGRDLGKPAAQRVLRLAHLTDLHVMPELRAGLGLERCLAACQAHGPDLILLGGDTVMDAFDADRARVKAQWDLATRVLRANAGVPVEACLGNHDVWGWGDLARFRHERDAGKRFALDALRLDRAYRSFDRAGWHFVVLDSIHPVAGNGYTARLDEAQFAWLAADLAATPADRPVLVLSHVPILSACAYFDGENESGGSWAVPGAWMHIDARRLKDLFRLHPNVRLCLAGHIHLLDRVEYLGVTYLCNGAVCGGWWKGPYQECANGYAIVDLFADGGFTSTYHTYPWPSA